MFWNKQKKNANDQCCFFLCCKKRVQVYSGMPWRKELLSDLKINGHLVLVTGVDGVLETFSPLFLFLFNPTAPVLGLFDQMWCYEDTILTRRWYFEDDRSLPEELPGVAAAVAFCDKKNVRIYHCVTIYALRDQPWNTCADVYLFLINMLCAGSKKQNIKRPYQPSAVVRPKMTRLYGVARTN